MFKFFARKQMEKQIAAAKESQQKASLDKACADGLKSMTPEELDKAAEYAYKQQQFTKARELLEELRKRDPLDHDPKFSLWYLTDICYWERGGLPADMETASKTAVRLVNTGTDGAFYRYVLGYVDKIGRSRTELPIPTGKVFKPNFELLEKRVDILFKAAKEHYEAAKKEGSKILQPSYQSIIYMEEIWNLRRVGYDKIEHTPENILSFFQELADKGDPTGQFWLYQCYYNHLFKEDESRELRNKSYELAKFAGLQGYPAALYTKRSEYPLPGSMSYSYDEKLDAYILRDKLLAKLDEYINEANTDDPLLSIDDFFNQKNAQQTAQKEAAALAAKAAGLYQQAVMAYAIGQQEQALADMAQAAELGHDGAYLWLVGRAAEQGSAQAQYQMGEYSLTGTASTPKNVTAAFEWLAKAASGGVADAFWRLGELYQHGADGFAANKEMAVSMYQKAAEGESLPGMLAYGGFCNPAEAKALYRRVVNTGRTDLATRSYIMEGWRKLAIVDPEDFGASLEGAAHFTLLYFDPDKNLGYTDKKPADAVKTALSGDSKTAYSLGNTLTSDKFSGDIADHKEIGRVWYQLTANYYIAQVGKGDPDACRNLFYIYHDELRDDSLARQWGIRALLSGDVEMYYVAAMNPKVFDLSEAQVIEYLCIAAANGDEGARNELEYRQRQAQWEANRQRWVEQVRREQAAAREREVDEAIAAKLDSAERLVNTLAYGEMFTDEERALMGKVSQMDAIRSASLRDDIIREMKKKLN